MQYRASTGTLTHAETSGVRKAPHLAHLVRTPGLCPIWRANSLTVTLILQLPFQEALQEGVYVFGFWRSVISPPGSNLDVRPEQRNPRLPEAPLLQSLGKQ